MLTEKDISNIKVTWKTLSYPEMKCKLTEFCGHEDMSFLDMVSALYWSYIETKQTQKEQAVEHAYWIELPKALNPNENPCKCSNCGHILSFMNHYPKSKHCPNCGARMNLKDGDVNG